HHRAVLKYQRLTSKPVQMTDSSCALAWYESENMPGDLMSAKLLLSESDIEVIWKDLRLVGRVDQAYENKQGKVILVDSKAHPKVTFRDQLQLSFYAYIMLKNGYSVSDVGYIRSFAYQDIEYLAVDIIPTQAFVEILSLID
ncbi:PD-(D/E)XK nuclease family protein, partial [Vibrio breoganii]